MNYVRKKYGLPFDTTPIGKLEFNMAFPIIVERGLTLDEAVWQFALHGWPAGNAVIGAYVFDEVGVAHLGYHYFYPHGEPSWIGTRVGYEALEKLPFIDQFEAAAAEASCLYDIAHPKQRPPERP